MINHNGAEDKGLFGAVIVNKKSSNVDINLGGQKNSVPLSSIQKDYVLYMLDDTFVGTEIDSAQPVNRLIWASIRRLAHKKTPMFVFISLHSVPTCIHFS